MKKLIMLLVLFAVAWCWFNQDKEIKQEFDLKKECSEYQKQLEEEASENWKDYDAYSNCEVEVFYSSKRNSCIAEKDCNAWWMRMYEIKDIFSNEELLYCTDWDDDCYDNIEALKDELN